MHDIVETFCVFRKVTSVNTHKHPLKTRAFSLRLKRKHVFFHANVIYFHVNYT